MIFCSKCDNFMDITRSAIVDQHQEAATASEDDMNESTEIPKYKPSTKYEMGSKIFYACTNCHHKQYIESQTLVLSKFTEHKFDDLKMFKDCAYSHILPRTRNYDCPNQNCNTKKDALKEAVFFRKNINTLQIVYQCCVCLTVWKN